MHSVNNALAENCNVFAADAAAAAAVVTIAALTVATFMHACNISYKSNAFEPYFNLLQFTVATTLPLYLTYTYFILYTIYSTHNRRTIALISPFL